MCRSALEDLKDLYILGPSINAGPQQLNLSNNPALRYLANLADHLIKLPRVPATLLRLEVRLLMNWKEDNELEDWYRNREAIPKDGGAVIQGRAGGKCRPSLPWASLFRGLTGLPGCCVVETSFMIAWIGIVLVSIRGLRSELQRWWSKGLPVQRLSVWHG